MGCAEAGDKETEEEAEPEPESEAEPKPIEKDIDIGVHTSLSGHIVVDQVVHTEFEILAVGDHTNNKLIKGYLSFDISSIGALDDVTIKNVSVTIPVDLIYNNPELASPKINIKVYDYGSSLDYPADQYEGGVTVKTLST